MQEKTLDDLVLSYRENRDAESFREIMRRLKPLISKRAGARIRDRVSKEDIQQAAALQVLQCVERFRPEKGSFSAFVSGFLQGAFRDEFSLSLPVSQITDQRLKAIRDHAPHHIATAICAGQTQAAAVESFIRHYDQPVSVQEVLTVVRHAETARSLDAYQPEADADPADSTLSRNRRDILFDALDCLSPVERSIIANRFLRDEPLSVYDAGAAAGICYKNVSRTAQKAIAKMSAALAEKGLSASDIFA